MENEIGQGLDDVNVVAFNPDAGGTFASTTTQEGEFLLTGLDPGHYVVRFTHPDHLSSVVFASVNPGEKYQLEETLEMVDSDDLTMTLSGIITDDDTGLPVDEAMVLLIDDNGNQGTSFYDTMQPHHYAMSTDDTGYYIFVGVYNGSFDLRVSMDGYYTDVSNVVIDNHTVANGTLATADDNYIKIYVEDDQGYSMDPDDVDVMMYEYDTGTWTQGDKSVLSHKFWPRDGDHLFIATPVDDGQYLSGVLELDVDEPGSHTLQLTQWSPMDRDRTFDFSDWDTFTQTMDSQLTFDDGRAFDARYDRDLMEPMTGLLNFDVDRIWGDNDGTAQAAEFTTYVEWEQDLDAGMTHTDAYLMVKDTEFAGYMYVQDTFTFELTDADGDPLGDLAVDATDGFNTIVTADYTAGMDDLDKYMVKLLAPNLQDDTHDLSYYLEWPTNFETTANVTNKTSGASVSGTPNTMVLPGEAPDDYDDAADGWVTLTVNRNELPTPVIDILTNLRQVEYLDENDDLMKVWVVNSTTQVNFTAEDSTDPQEIMNYTWLFNGAQVVRKYGIEVNNTFDALPQDNTNATITLTLADAHTENGTTIDIYVDDTAPTAIFNMTVKHAAGADGEPYTFDDTNDTSNLDENPDSTDVMVFDASNSTDAGFLGQNALVNYDWLFSDNQTYDGPIISRGFKDPGDNTVTLTVTDAAGNTDTMSMDFSVNDVEAPEAAYTWCGYNESGNCTPNAGFVGRSFEFNASITEDNSGVVASYLWDVTKAADDVEDQFTIEQLLFTLQTAELESAIGDGEIPDDLRQAFDDNGIDVEAGTMLTPVQSEFANLLDETRWHIETDDGNYTIKDDGTVVNIFADSPSDEAEVVIVTFLEYKDEGYSVTLTVTDASGNDAQYMRTIKPARPDLPDLFSPNIVMTPETVNEGDTITFEVDIKLLGLNVTDAFHVSFYKDDIGEGSLLDNQTVTPDEINGATERTLTLTVTWKKPSPGDHTFIVFVDSGSEVYEGALDEKVETNNQQFTPFFVTEKTDEGTSKWLIIGILGVVAFLGIAGYYFLMYRPGLYDDE